MVVSSTQAKSASRQSWLAKAGAQNSLRPTGMRAAQFSSRLLEATAACAASWAEILRSGEGQDRESSLEATPGSCRGRGGGGEGKWRGAGGERGDGLCLHKVAGEDKLDATEGNVGAFADVAHEEVEPIEELGLQRVKKKCVAAMRLTWTIDTSSRTSTCGSIN